MSRANPIPHGESQGPEGEPWRNDARVAELEEQVQQLRAALEARGRRLVSDQVAYADYVQGQNLVIARLQEDIGILEAEIEGRKQAYEDLVNTRTFRYTATLRAVYGTIRDWIRGR